MRNTKLSSVILLLIMIVIAKESFALEKVRLQLKWKHQFQFAGYYAAVKNGYYRDVDLDVELLERTPIKTPFDSVLNGDADYGISGSEIISEWLAGKPISVVAVIFQHSPVILITLTESGLTNPQQLVGKKAMLGTMTPSADVEAMLFKEGVSLDKLTQLRHSFNITDLIKGTTDVMGAYSITLPFYLDKIGVKYNIISPTTYGFDFYGDVLFTSLQEIEHHPERVKNFREASLKGWEYALSHVDEMVEFIDNHYNTERRNLSKEYFRFEAEATRKLIIPDLIKLGHVNQDRWERIAQTYVGLGLARSDYSLDGFIYDPNPKTNVAKYYWIIGLIVLICGLIGLVAIVLFRLNSRLKGEIVERKQAEEQIKANLKEKETLLHEIHHRVKNNMQVISSLLKLQANSIEDDRIRDALKESQNRIYTMSAVHETLHGSENLSEIDLKGYLSKVTTSIFQTYNVNPSKVKLNINMDDMPISIKQASPLGLIVNELLSNSLKYSFPKDRKGVINVSMNKLDKNIQLTVMDDGIGMPNGFDWKNSKSLGLKLVRTLVENQLDGSIDLDNKNGTKFIIKFNIES